MLLQWINALPSLLTAGLAVYAVTAWRRDFIGRRRIELAEEVLSLFYKARDAISAIRNIAGFSSESKERQPEPDENSEQKRLRDAAFIAIERYKQNSDTFNRLHALRYQFMARFGTETVQAFDGLHQVTVEIIVGARQLQRLSARAGGPQTRPEIEKSIEQAEARILQGSAEEDPVSPKVDAMISQIEAITRPIINPARPWHDRACAMLNRLTTRFPRLKLW
ncbi:MAG TPA: hypothetical protein VN823_09205 [Stellaceae bacterium]|nr:hypothetical protein [Stellaceae bacterium]